MTAYYSLTFTPAGAWNTDPALNFPAWVLCRTATPTAVPEQLFVYVGEATESAEALESAEFFLASGGPAIAWTEVPDGASGRVWFSGRPV